MYDIVAGAPVESRASTHDIVLNWTYENSLGAQEARAEVVSLASLRTPTVELSIRDIAELLCLMMTTDEYARGVGR